MPSRADRRGLPPLVASILAVAALAASPSGCAREAPCQFNSDCPVGYCQSGACQKNCVDSSRDCPSGFTCDANAQCVPGGSGGGSSTSASASATGSGGASSTSTGASTSTTTTSATTSTSASSAASSTSGGPGSEHELDPCTSDAQCASPLLCRPMVPGGAKRCTRACTSSVGCMTGTRCELVGGTQYCAGDDVGRTCASAAACNFGCLGAYCTAACNTGSDCPNGYGCMGVGAPPTRVCVKAEAACATGSTSACLGPAFCDESPQLVVGGCSVACASAFDCPQRAAGLPAWTCDGVLCRRPPDVSGPLQSGATPAQYACNAQSVVVNVCNDGQHLDFTQFTIPSPPQVSCGATMTTAGAPGDSCVDSCRYEGGCPFGFACVAVGGVGNARIGLCLPTGAGEVGTPCAHDAECTFGYCTAAGKCSRDCTADGVCPGGAACLAGGGPPVEGQSFRRCQ